MTSPLERLEQKLKENPEDLRLLAQVGLYYLKERRMADAEPLFERLVSLAPEDDRYRSALVECKLGLRDPEGAREHLKRLALTANDQPRTARQLERYAEMTGSPVALTSIGNSEKEPIEKPSAEPKLRKRRRCRQQPEQKKPKKKVKKKIALRDGENKPEKHGNRHAPSQATMALGILHAILALWLVWQPIMGPHSPDSFTFSTLPQVGGFTSSWAQFMYSSLQYRAILGGAMFFAAIGLILRRPWSFTAAAVASVAVLFRSGVGFYLGKPVMEPVLLAIAAAFAVSASVLLRFRD